MVTALFIACVGIVQPLFSKVFMDSILTREHTEWMYPFIGLMATVVVFELVVTYLKSVYSKRLEGKFAIVANTGFIWHVLHLPMNFFSQRSAGDLSGRQGLNQGITNTLISDIAPTLLDMVTLILYLVIMLRYRAILTLVGIAAVAINLFSARIISDKIMNLSRVAMREQGKVESVTTSGIEMIETIKASGAENGFFQRWSGDAAERRHGK